MTDAEQAKNPSQNEYTIIRIKRKRTEDVPDMLVVDDKGSNKKKSGTGIFQFAETIDEAAWKEIKQDELRDRISAISRSGPKRTPDEVKKEDDASTPAPSKRQRTDGAPRQYRVITKEPRQASRSSAMPPKVLSSKVIEKSESKIKIYDAELAPPETTLDVDPEMEKFQTLLQDYLKVHDDIPERTSGEDSTVLTNISSSTSGDYVYDIFYHRPFTLAEQAGVANMATITGLPFDEEDDFESESEIEDEADEDSNAEDYYKNDYPDEESSRSNSEGTDFWSEDEWDDSGRFEPDY